MLKQEILKNSAILIVDDIAKTRQYLGSLFREAGFSNVRMVEDNNKAIEIIDNWTPNIILIDLSNPNSSFECLNKIRSFKKFQNTPVIIQSFISYQQGIEFSDNTELALKPLDAEEILIRSYIKLEKSMLSAREEKINRDNSIDGFTSLSKINFILSPDQQVGNLHKIEDIYKIEITSYLRALSSLSGDFWGIFPISKDEFAFYIVDFCGHGLSAAINTFHLYRIMTGYRSLANNPMKFIEKINNKLFMELPRHEYATMFYAVLNVENNSIRYITAANPYPLVITKNGELEYISHGEGIPVGVNKDTKYYENRMILNKGDSLFFYSDALIETKNNLNEYLDSDNLKKLLSNYIKDNISSNKLYNKIFYKLLENFQKEYFPRLEDDLTMVMLTRL